ncbi:MAG TPA: ferritin-like domain-containing protein [Tepidisphaeraceae bacterium]|nr:ferritin-like domain-containing protein [Tepidisphaeraceae bacterium]
MHLDQIRATAPARRAFLSRMRWAGLGAAAAALLSAAAPGAQAKSGKTLATRGGGRTAKPLGVEGTAAAAFPGTPGSSNNEIVLNYALTLERLEADLYRQALNKATGRALSAPLAASAAAYKQTVPDGPFRCEAEAVAAFAYLRDFAYVEAAHRDFLIAAMQATGLAPVGPNPGGYKFPTALPASLYGILQQVIPLEETGVRAYLGAAGFLTDLGLVQVAGTIYTTEARHSAVINLVLNAPVGPVTLPGDKEVVAGPPSPQTFEKFLDPATVIAAVTSTYFA